MVDLKSKVKIAGIAALLGIGIAYFGYAGFRLGRSVEYKISSPSSVEMASDLDNDGADDIVLTLTGGHKVPLYRINDEGNERYVIGETKKVLDPESLADYETIEQRLNQ